MLDDVVAGLVRETHLARLLPDADLERKQKAWQSILDAEPMDVPGPSRN